MKKVKHPVKPVKKAKPVLKAAPAASTADLVKHLRSVYVMVAPTAHTKRTTLVMIVPSVPTTTKPIKHHVQPVPMDDTKIPRVKMRVSLIKTVMKVPTDRSGILKPVWCAKRAPRDAIQMIQTLFSVSVVL